MLSAIKRKKAVFVFSLFMGIYQVKRFPSKSIELSLVGGIDIIKKGGSLPYIEVAEWLFIMSFFLMLSSEKLKEKNHMYIYEVTRCRSYRAWCFKFYKSLLGDTLCNVMICVVIWYLMDSVGRNKKSFPILAVVLFVSHILCCVAMTGLLNCVTVRNEYIYLPVLMEGGTLLLAEKYETMQIWFWGAWGMYKRSEYMNPFIGFRVYAVILIEVLIIVISCLVSSGGRRRKNEFIYSDS